MATEEILYNDAVQLLQSLISTPSFSREEADTAALISAFLQVRNCVPEKAANNVFVRNRYFDPAKPTMLLNSHHDTVKPNKGYTLDPFEPALQDGKLFGLGSNDAGGCLVSLIAAFLHFYEKQDMDFNLLLAATAEEEISGTNGIEMLLPQLGKIDCAIVGEPTLLEMAVAERGLLVVDVLYTGRAGHAARNEGENALYKALDDLNWIRNYTFEKKSDLLGDTKMTATVMETENKQHNVVPPQCRLVLDIRLNEKYTFEEVLQLLQQLTGTVTPRSLRLKSTSIALDHPLVKAGLQLGKGYYGSPTTSDKALMPFPALKMGPGDSARSHTADDFIYLDEIREGIQTYIRLLNQVLMPG